MGDQFSPVHTLPFPSIPSCPFLLLFLSLFPYEVGQARWAVVCKLSRWGLGHSPTQNQIGEFLP